MKPNLTPLHVLAVTLAGWLNREQLKALRYLKAENEVLRKQLGKKRLRLTDDERRRLAVLGKDLGRRLLHEWATIVTPDTILRWHRKLIAMKWTYRRGGPGRPGVMKKITELAVRMARENETWGYRRIQGALENVGHTVAWTTVRNILKRHGIEPAPDRGAVTPWRTFLKAHFDSIAAMDFFSVEVWTTRGLVTHYVLFAIDLRTRAVEIAGITTKPAGRFMMNCAKNLTDPFEGFLTGKGYLIMDRDGKFTDAFKGILEAEGIQIIHTPVRAPNANAFAERFVLSIKSECLNRMIFFGRAHLERATSEYVAHYHEERNHQGIENKLIQPAHRGTGAGDVVSSERLGGLLRFYHRQAA